MLDVFCSKVVTATASSEAKLDWLRSIPNGATHTANYKLENPSWPSEVKKFTNDKGVNVIIDFVGQTHFQGNIDSLALEYVRDFFFLSHNSQRSLFCQWKNDNVGIVKWWSSARWLQSRNNSIQTASHPRLNPSLAN